MRPGSVSDRTQADERRTPVARILVSQLSRTERERSRKERKEGRIENKGITRGKGGRMMMQQNQGERERGREAEKMISVR